MAAALQQIRAQDANGDMKTFRAGDVVALDNEADVIRACFMSKTPFGPEREPEPACVLTKHSWALCTDLEIIERIPGKKVKFGEKELVALSWVAVNRADLGLVDAEPFRDPSGTGWLRAWFTPKGWTGPGHPGQRDLVVSPLGRVYEADFNGNPRLDRLLFNVDLIRRTDKGGR